MFGIKKLRLDIARLERLRKEEFWFVRRAFAKVAPTYMCEVMCPNCRNQQPCEIPRGITEEQFMVNRKCSNCGCIMGRKAKK